MSTGSATPRISASADIGGTFTDVVAVDSESGELVVGKSPTLAENPVGGIIGALSGAGVDMAEVNRFFHGTTLGINALLERKGATVGLVTTSGFRDMLSIGSGAWPLFRLTWNRDAPLVARRLSRSVTERVRGDGSIAVPLDLDDLGVAVDELVAAGVEAIAVCFLNSYRTPDHELIAGEEIVRRHPGMVVTLSHEISQRYHELPRAATAVGEAYLRPTMRRYFDQLADGMAERDFSGNIFITSSDGGVMSLGHARDRALRTLVSGCASGVCGAAAVAGAAGWDSLLAVDMGGTSFDAAVIRHGQPDMRMNAQIADQEFLMPMLDLATIGAGGGSIAQVDAVGALHVGPRSAGSKPGPVCYGRGGTMPTVTDAALVAGLLPSSLLDGGMELSVPGATEAIEREVGEALSLPVAEAAQGILTIVEAKMGRLLDELTIGKGLDPRDFTLFAYGGGGPLVAARLAEELGITRVVIPVHAGVFSAWGMQTLDVVHELSRTAVSVLEDGGEDFGAPFEPLVEQASSWLRADGFTPSDTVLLRFLELRYASQDHVLLIPFVDGAEGVGTMRAAFDAAHSESFGFTVEGEIEVVAYRVRALGHLTKVDVGNPGGAAVTAAVPGAREVWESSTNSRVEWPVFRREMIGVESPVVGPAIIEEATATTVVPNGWTVERHDHGHLVMER